MLDSEYPILASKQSGGRLLFVGDFHTSHPQHAIQGTFAASVPDAPAGAEATLRQER
jgi:hypothetical protein